MNAGAARLPYAALPRAVRVLFLGGVVTSLGSFVFPFLTIFLTETLGLTKAEASRFVVAAAAAEVVGAVAGGKLADRFPRKRVYVAFAGVAACLLVPCALLGRSLAVPWILIAARAFQGASGPANAALVADCTTPESRPSAYALLYLGTNLGFAVGPAIAGLLYAEHLEWFFLGDALTTLVALGLVLALVPETMPDPAGAVRPAEAHETAGLARALAKRPHLVVFALIGVAYSFVYGMQSFALPVQADATLGPLDGPKLYGALMAVNGVTVVLLTTPVTRLARRRGPLVGIAVAGLAYAAGFGMLAALGVLDAADVGATIALFGLSTVTWTVGEILQTTQQNVYLANNTPASHRGRFLAVLPIGMRAGYALGPLITGPLLDAEGATAAWPLAAGVGVCAAASMGFLAAKRRQAGVS